MMNLLRSLHLRVPIATHGMLDEHLNSIHVHTFKSP